MLSRCCADDEGSRLWKLGYVSRDSYRSYVFVLSGWAYSTVAIWNGVAGGGDLVPGLVLPRARLGLVRRSEMEMEGLGGMGEVRWEKVERETGNLNGSWLICRGFVAVGLGGVSPSSGYEWVRASLIFHNLLNI